MCCSIVPFGEGLGSGLGFDAPLFVDAPVNRAPKQFYYQIDGSIIGPVNGIQLRQAALAGQIVPVTLVANDPNGKWVTANHVRGLFDESGRPKRHREDDDQDARERHPEP